MTARTALVTGGATGIGAAIVTGLTRHGARVAFTHLGHDATDVEAATANLEGTSHGHRVDLTAEDASDRLNDIIAGLGGHLDVAVLNAGGMVARSPLADGDLTHWRRVMELNLTSCFITAAACLPAMTTGGRVIVISSLAARNGGGPGAGAYASAKAGTEGFVRALAKELGPHGITVNAVAPGLILGTPFHEQFTPAQAQRAAVGGIPIGRAGTPEDVAATVLWLADASSSFISGATVDLNGAADFS